MASFFFIYVQIKPSMISSLWPCKDFCNLPSILYIDFLGFAFILCSYSKTGTTEASNYIRKLIKWYRTMLFYERKALVEIFLDQQLYRSPSSQLKIDKIYLSLLLCRINGSITCLFDEKH